MEAQFFGTTLEPDSFDLSEKSLSLKHMPITWEADSINIGNKFASVRKHNYS
jgi:hypothetical protein